ncbi:MAG: hypothetical protein RIS35_3386 [Pseudomonadota bacterium]
MNEPRDASQHGTRSGRAEDEAGAKAAALAVIGDPAADPALVIEACSALAHHEIDAGAFSAAAKAFQTLGRPLRHASAMLGIARRVAHFPSVRELTRELSAAYAEGRFDEAGEAPPANLSWCVDESINIAVATHWSKRVMPELAEPPAFHSPPTGRRLRIGYLSSDFLAPPTRHRILGLLDHHDRSRFESFIYDASPRGDPALDESPFTQADHVHRLAALDDREAAERIRSHGLDLLVELDGPTRSSRMRLLAHRPAPVQVSDPGSPGSVGGRVVDYLVADRFAVPPGREEAYPEKLIRVDASGLFVDARGLEGAGPPDRSRVGLPPGKVVVGFFSPVSEIHAPMWALWMELLKRLPNVVIWMPDPGPLARRHLAIAARRVGMEQMNRVIRAPDVSRQDHLARLGCCDLVLHPWSGGGLESLQDALSVGVPVLALEVDNVPGRIAAGLLRAAGLDALVQPDSMAYARKAEALIGDGLGLRRLKADLRANAMRPPVFDAERRTRQFEAACARAVGLAFRGPVPVAKPKLVLVCGPWSSGTSAMAGFLAKAGLFAPGPYFRVNDPRTPETYEMLAFREVMLRLGSEQALKPLVDRKTVIAMLEEFARGPLAAALRQAGHPPTTPVLLKHGLPAMFLREFAEVFDLRVIGVLRPLKAIEATRKRRKWQASFGRAGAITIYTKLMQHLVDSATPFRLVRYSDLMERPAEVLEELESFCGLTVDAEARDSALAFVRR